ncbi:MAG TPA: carboxypeptidase-like regulatory domain-containing protein, partial [Candidatus Ozemobacteraceae bacterium]|nr:carboxypeptidase-like regulatory domain-containing protein [Candidatus Ozemobacteraceae bacterium]
MMFFTGCGGVNSSADESGGKPLYITDLDSGGISGAVTSSASVAIDQAIVEAGNNQAITASNGTFLMLNLAAGDYRVTARAHGYTPSYRENIRVRSGMITEGVNITMTDATATATHDFEVVSLSPAFGTDGDRIAVVARGIGT